MAKTRKVELTFPWTDPDGTDHESGKVLDLDDLTARRLIHGGRARVPSESTPEPAQAPNDTQPAQEPADTVAAPETTEPAALAVPPIKKGR